MTYLTESAHLLFAAQHGVASLDQLVQCGLTARQVEHLESRGALSSVVRGAYRSPSVRLDELGMCTALCLARPDVAISGPTAARLWGFRRVSRDRRIHVIGPPASNPSINTAVQTYRTAAIHDGDVIERPDGIRLTSRARTAFDLARTLSSNDLLSVIEQAMNDGRLTEEQMWSVAVDWISPQRRWIERYLNQLCRRVGGGNAESHPEVRVGQALKAAGVIGLERQLDIDLPGYGRARFDIAVPSLRWAIEVDIHPTHRETSGRESDERRDNAAESLGWTISRIRNQQYEQQFGTTIGELVTRYRHLSNQR